MRGRVWECKTPLACLENPAASFSQGKENNRERETDRQRERETDRQTETRRERERENESMNQ